MAILWLNDLRKCGEHGHYSAKQWGESCPVCSGKIGRKTGNERDE